MIANRKYSLLPNRAVLRLSGEDTRSFLQGLVSNDVEKVSNSHTIYAAMLTPQGKYLYDFFIAQDGQDLLLDTEKSRLEDLIKRLTMYKLRARVTLTPQLDSEVIAIFGQPSPSELISVMDAPGATARMTDGIGFVDSRHAGMGVRLIAKKDALITWLQEKNIASGDEDSYERHRLKLGIPDSSRDLPPERALLLENGFEELHGVDFAKGCYVGQEVTARSKHRATLRKYLHQVEATDARTLPASGTPVTVNGQEIGSLRTSQDGIGLAMLQWQEVEKAQQTQSDIMAGDIRITASLPAWFNRIPAPADSL